MEKSSRGLRQRPSARLQCESSIRPHEVSPMTLAPWQPNPGYLNTASFGVPCPQAAEAVNEMVTAWTRGELSFGPWFTETQQVRESIARLLAVPMEHVSLGTSTA